MVAEREEFGDLINMEDPQEVFGEVKKIVLLMYSDYDFLLIEKVFKDIVRLFNGEYPGYQRCNTWYHNLKHTTDCLLSMTRLAHGAFINEAYVGENNLTLGLIAALMHDTGYIQQVGDNKGTGAKYTMNHIDRSVAFLKKYFLDHGFSPEDFRFCHNCLKCTGVDVKIQEIHFESRDNEILGKLLGAADLLGQMSDRTYLERLPFLYREFKEGGVPGFADEMDLLRKTPGFWELTQRRFAQEFSQVDRYSRDHFRVRWGIDKNLDREAIERNMKYLTYIIEHYGKDYRKHLLRKNLITMLMTTES